MRKVIFTLHLILLLLALLPACHSTKNTGSSYEELSEKELKELIQLHIKSMNERDFATLKKLYHDDFSSINPEVSFDQTSDLLASMENNLKANGTLVKGDILQTTIHHNTAYAVLRWRIVYPLPDSDQWEITLDRHLLEIWQINEQKEWQLWRVLFYQAE